MTESEFKPGISFKRGVHNFKLVENGKGWLPDMICIKRGDYYEFYANVEKVEDGVASIVHSSPIGELMIRENVVLAKLTLIK